VRGEPLFELVHDPEKDLEGWWLVCREGALGHHFHILDGHAFPVNEEVLHELCDHIITTFLRLHGVER
jgi:hypothetical protein